MNNIDYQINYNANDIFYIEIVKRCNEWSTELEAIQKAINEIVEMESFSGSSAENLKSYLSEVHSIVCVALWQLIVEFQSRFLLYKDKYYEFDSNIYSVLDFDTMKYYYDKTSELKSDLEDAGSKISSALLDICDIIDLSNPSTGTLLTNLEYINEQIDKLDNSIINHESDQVTSAMKNLNDMIYNLDIMLESYKNMNSGIKDYHAGDCLSYEAVLCLGGNIQTSMDYISENEEAINTAYERLTKTYEQMQADAEAAAADARTDTGTAEVIRGVGSVALGVFAIVASGGAATPIVVTAYVAGGCSIAYGVSNVVEGGQEIYYGLEGDLETKSFNPIRDTVFVGNQSAYDTWGKLSMAVAAITIPVGKTVTRLQTAGASGEVLAKNVAFTIGKEVVVDELSDKAVGYTTSHIVETWGLNQTQSTLVQMGLSAVATIGTGKLEDTLTESKFASQMSPDDAARYNAWSDKCQYGTPNRYPGLSEIDVALWNKANVKVDEAVALSKVDAEAFAKLKKVEFKENFDDARHSVNRVDNVVEGGTPTIKYTEVKTFTAEETNQWFIDNVKPDYKPPYKPETLVKEIELTENTTFVRVYDNMPDGSGMYGSWVMKAEDIEGLTPLEIQNKFALPNTPKYVCDVELEAGTHIRVGEVNPLDGWGSGGGTQYDLIGQRIGDFKNERLLEGN